MIRAGHNDVNFFTGIEVEHTVAHNKHTLFVVGVQDAVDISLNLSRARTGIEHIYFGANMSFPKEATTEDWQQWKDMIVPFLELGHFCSLDIDASCAEGLVASKLCKFYNFIPMISVKLPSIHKLGYNATIKLDDKDFNATNPGVWCHSLHDLKTRDKFTDWSKYTKDEPL